MIRGRFFAAYCLSLNPGGSDVRTCRGAREYMGTETIEKATAALEAMGFPFPTQSVF
ncbi:hypothetical protein RGR602_CH03409 [Rhizobium gallicum bv. gallicum R602sp]|uniref:Uncharacterized protein n=1 Tax=Rhizobium gallicum bv. gallicum R602sp TaxID=1041138 RepID=A0A0B4X897_9HYPH|nr:hypothetical protein RGR602_CH03409 [Rhizobium gallicum bv. gallicum R602sp]